MVHGWFVNVHDLQISIAYGMAVSQVLNVSNESKAWVADPANRICDIPGSWYCVGQHLGLDLAAQLSFAQLNSAFDPGGCNCQCQHMSTVDLMIWQIGIGTKIPSEIEETDLQKEELLAA